MLDRDLVVGKAMQIYGAFSTLEARALFDKAMECGKKANFVEIGSLCGRSSTILGQVARENDCSLVCIDFFVDKAPMVGSLSEMEVYFRKNMDEAEAKYDLWVMDSKDAAPKYEKNIDLLFIDANHHQWGVEQDCKLWLPKLKVGGYVLFHDYKSSWEGVRKAVDEMTSKHYDAEELVDSMMIKRKEIG
jgi:predicted O-methyltransferase YrrM